MAALGNTAITAGLGAGAGYLTNAFGGPTEEWLNLENAHRERHNNFARQWNKSPFRRMDGDMEREVPLLSNDDIKGAAKKNSAILAGLLSALASQTGGLAAAAATPGRTIAEQRSKDKEGTSWKHWLIPGYATYEATKQRGAYGGSLGIQNNRSLLAGDDSIAMRVGGPKKA